MNAATTENMSIHAAEAPLLEVMHLKKYFPVKDRALLAKREYVHAVDDVSFEVYPHETLGIVGESGCGKSTLLQTIMRIVPATEGEITFCGKDWLALSKDDLRKLRKEMQIVFQDPYSSLDPRMTIGEAIGEPFEIHTRLDSKEIKDRVLALLRCVGLGEEYYDRHPHEFSGGQRQRISIARAIALRPKLVLCDEPVSALEVSIDSQILNLLKDLQKQFGLTYIFISHALNVVKHVSDRVAVMYLGRIVEIASVYEIYEHPRHPYTQALLSSIPVISDRGKTGRERIVLEGDLPNPKNPPTGCRFHTRCRYATPICAREEPELRTCENGTQVACHSPIKI